jgi:transposase-like protein
MFPYGNGYRKYSRLADRFKVNRHLIKEILVVDETLLKVNGQAYWLWIAYEPNTKSCLMIHLSRERTIFLYAISSLKTA